MGVRIRWPGTPAYRARNEMRWWVSLMDGIEGATGEEGGVVNESVEEVEEMEFREPRPRRARVVRRAWGFEGPSVWMSLR